MENEPNVTEEKLTVILKTAAEKGMFTAVIASMAEMAAKTGTIPEYGAALSEHMATFLASMGDPSEADELMRMIKEKAGERRGSAPKPAAGVPSEAAMILSKAAHQVRGRDEQTH